MSTKKLRMISNIIGKFVSHYTLYAVKIPYMILGIA